MPPKEMTKDGITGALLRVNPNMGEFLMENTPTFVWKFLAHCVIDLFSPGAGVAMDAADAMELIKVSDHSVSNYDLSTPTRIRSSDRPQLLAVCLMRLPPHRRNAVQFQCRTFHVAAVPAIDLVVSLLICVFHANTAAAICQQNASH